MVHNIQDERVEFFLINYMYIVHDCSFAFNTISIHLMCCGRGKDKTTGFVHRTRDAWQGSGCEWVERVRRRFRRACHWSASRIGHRRGSCTLIITFCAILLVTLISLIHCSFPQTYTCRTPLRLKKHQLNSKFAFVLLISPFLRPHRRSTQRRFSSPRSKLARVTK
jgi:hypothetical protein